MNIELMLRFEGPGVCSHIIKEYESNIKPCIGDKITDYLWEDGECEVVDVNINYMDNELYVTIAPYKVTNREHYEEVLKAAKSHGWSVPSEKP